MGDFNFYMKLAKPLALNLPDAKDRTMAAQWLKKLCQIDQSSFGTSDNIHVEYLKLLLFVMQGNQLTGIFEEPPPDGDLQDFLQLPTEQRKKAKDMIALTKRRRISRSDGSSLNRNGCLPIRRSIGGDLCEYVAVQEIPDFGIHGYYALSTEPMSNWWNPSSSASASEPKAFASPCYKATCEIASAGPIEDNPEGKLSPEEIRELKASIASRKESEHAASLSLQDRSAASCEKIRHGEKSLRKIFETRKNKIAAVETRPCWGRSRYIERLIDESPHLVGDLDLSEADALLHAYREKKLKKIYKSESKESKGNLACILSSRRKQVEARLDMPPCASVPVEQNFKGQQDTCSETKQGRTCLPRKNVLSHRTDQQPVIGRQCCGTETEGQDSYGGASAISISLYDDDGDDHGGSEFSSRSYLGAEFQYNRTYEKLCQDCEDDLRNNTTDA